ncbi:MAG: serpin family protein [Micrococcales bacterium]|nr:serpin family protein [Micrococcales bacterium]
MRTRRSIIWVAAALAGLVAGCGHSGSDDPATTAPAPTTAPAATADVVAATWELGVLMLRAGEGPNVVVAPASLVTALSMLAEGAVGDESAPLDTAVGAAGEHRTKAVAWLVGALARYGGDPAVVQDEDLPATPVLHTAQGIALDDDTEPAPAFLERLTKGYGAQVVVTDLSTQQGMDVLSAWVSQNTGGLVDTTGIQPDSETLAVLQDAFVLAAAWAQPFDPDGTYDADFWVPAPTGRTVKVPTMHAELDVKVADIDGWVAVRLAYTPDLSADLLLPSGCCPPDAVCDCANDPKVDDPRRVAAPTLAALSTALDQAPSRTVELAVPTLDLATTTSLMQLLASLGIDDELGLTGVLANGDPVIVGQAVQQTVLQVAEDGTRAAAATEISIMPKSAPLPGEVEKIRFDRPFLLVIRDGTTGWPVLLASVNDPR